MDTFFKKLIPNNIAVIIGIASAVIPLVREIAVAVIRIIDIFTPGEGMEPLIVKIGDIFDEVIKGVDKFKNMFLGV